MSGSDLGSDCGWVSDPSHRNSRSLTNRRGSCGAGDGDVVRLVRTPIRVCFLVVLTWSVDEREVHGLGKRTGLRVEDLYESAGLFRRNGMTTLCLEVGRLEVRGIVVSVAQLGRVEFVSAAWVPGLLDMVDLDMKRGLRHHYCMSE